MLGLVCLIDMGASEILPQRVSLYQSTKRSKTMRIERLINGLYRVEDMRSGLVGVYNPDGSHRGLFNFGPLDFNKE